MQALELTEQGKPHAQIIEKFLAKWLQAHIVETEQAFQEGIARQLKPSEQSSKFKGNLTCLNDWIASPQLSIFSNVAIAQDLSHALNEQKQLQYGKSILTLDGYHVGQDWVIALMYDDESQSAQGMLSHRIRLDEIEQVLQKQQPELQALDQIIVQQKMS